MVANPPETKIETLDLPLLLTRKRMGEAWLHTFLSMVLYLGRGPGSSVGIVIELRTELSGIVSRCGRDFPPVQTGPGTYPASCKMGTWSFPGYSAAGACC